MISDKLTFKQRLYRKICYLFERQLPDKLYIELMYQVKLGEKCDLKNPKSFDEKLNYLKLNDRKDEYSKMADKYEVRDYIAGTIGDKYLIPLLGVWENPEDIDINALPKEFVLKCTHDSASVVICKDKDNFDFEKAKQKLGASLKENYFYHSREWPYKNIKPRIIAEKYMVDESGSELKDYKIYCFDGKPHMIQVDFGRFVKHERNLYDTEWNYIDKTIEYPRNPNHQIARPKSLEKMLELAGVLSKGIPSVRIDFYDINGELYFGEITFYQEGGFAQFDSPEFAYELGELIRIN